MSETLTNWTARQKVSASHLNEAWNLLRKMAGAAGYDLNDLSRPPEAEVLSAIRFGEIVDVGAAGASDYTDERYWVRESVILPADTWDDPVDWQYVPDATLTIPDISNPGSTTSTVVESVYTVTNLPEVLGGSHELPVGMPVMFFEFRDGQDPTPNIRFLMSVGAPGGIILVSLQQIGGVDGTKTTAPTYTYDMFTPTIGATGPLGTPGGLVASNQSPLRPRTIGAVTPATMGLAVRYSGGYRLLEAFEVPETYACPT